MAAPLKNGLDYFTLDCVFDDKVELVIAEFGMKGLGVLVKLWQKIYNSEGYYCLWDSDVALMFSNKISTAESVVSVNVVSEIISACIRRGVFDRGMYERCGILTSTGIQKRYFEATKRRQSLNVIGEYLLIKAPSNAVNVNNNSINVNNNSQNVNSNSQSKVKESKVKESKVNNNRSASGLNIDGLVPEPIRSVFLEYVKMRKSIKKPISTEHAVKLAISKLEKLAPGNYEIQIAILNQSILNSWQGLFELKDGGGYSEPGQFKASRT